MPAVWLPYGSTSISIRVDPEDLAWVVSRELATDYSMLLSALKNSLKDSTRSETVLVDPTLPTVLKEGLPGRSRELLSFDLLSPVSTMEDSIGSACLASCPHPDPLIGFRGLGENLFPFYPEIWRRFATGFLEAVDSGGKIDLKPYLNELSRNIDLKVVTLIPLASGPKVLSLSPVEAYEALNSLQSTFVESPRTPVQILVVSAGGNPFDESFSRAMSVIPNCLQGVECDRVVLAIEGSKGLGLSPDLVAENAGPDLPLIVKYTGFCRKLLNGKIVHVVSTIPESLLRTLLECRAHDALVDAYKASRLFLAKGSKTSVVTHASFTILRFESPENHA